MRARRAAGRRGARRAGSSSSSRRCAPVRSSRSGPELTIGRAGGCSIVLDEQYVSQVHSRVFVRDGAVFAEDLGSTNGTWVNGARAIGQMPARLGDRIQIGNVVMEVR